MFLFSKFKIKIVIINIMKWEQVLLKWKSGSYPKFSKMKKHFIWRTSPYYNDSIYLEECIYAPGLNFQPNSLGSNEKF